ncbi:protein slit-like [Dendronephthya gigantea]|uniref:protein slit-like n=1 Tax=Dendronephthya gigantea TaxID=151771 RepID=UPI00106C67FC|nr:protein slit-like [Dendronephthya gigantea]
MASIDPIVRLLLLLYVVVCYGDVCQRKCKCYLRMKMWRVICRNKGIKDINLYTFPNDMDVLDLSRNNITILRRNFLDNHYKLRNLYLHKNSISVFEERAFVGLDNLERLQLRKNNLVELKNKAFEGLPKLKTLFLENNSFTTILNGTFDELTSLKKIALKGVPLVCDCKLNPFMRFVAKHTIKFHGTCQSEETLGDLKGIDLCGKKKKIKRQ